MPDSIESIIAKKPGLVVFDLDHTLWPFGMEYVKPPFYTKGLTVYDTVDLVINHYLEVPQVLQYLKDEGIPMAAASRTNSVVGANQLIDIFGWDKFFSYRQIYPGCKTEHFEAFARDSGLPHTSMMFFDDEGRNLRDVSEVGVHCVLVKNGINLQMVKDALKAFPKKCIQNWNSETGNENR